jgi:dolichol-phosphate mannosyltransferase
LISWPDATAAVEHEAVLVVIPTYNERENLQVLLPELLDLGAFVSVLVVDDNSPDGTGNVADRFATQYRGRVFALHRPVKQGIGPAYIAGFREALQHGTPFVAQMDADRSHRPSDLLCLLDAARSHDLVLGSRYVPGGSTEGWPSYRRAISRFGGWYARAVLDVPVNDLTGGFKVFRREVLEHIGLDEIRSDGYVFQIETTYRALNRGFSVVEQPIRFTDRIAGKSKLSRKIVLEAVLVVWRLRFDRSLQRDIRLLG